MTTMHTSDEAANNVDAENGRTTDGSTAAPVEVTEQERKSAIRWHNQIRISRAFDEEVRKRYAVDRKYCRAESSATVQYSLIQAYIDILVAFLVARNPDFDCTPAPSVGQDGVTDIELYGKTMEIIVSHLLRSARLKRKAARLVRSALSVGVGWLKATWQERWDTDPHIKDQLSDSQQNLAQIGALIKQIQSGEVKDLAAATARLTELQMGMATRTERLIATGMALDVINPEDMVFSLDCDSVMDADSSSWMGNRYFLHVDIALADFPELTEEQINAATAYAPRKPRKRKDQDTNGEVANVSEDDADAYIKGVGEDIGKNKFLCCWEIWDGEANTFFTLIEGIGDRFAQRPAPPPTPTERFYPYFGLSFTEVDGERHPQSLVQRSSKLQDEVERSMTALITHRRRAIPKMGFDATKVSKATVKMLEGGVTQEFVAIKFVGGVDPERSDLDKVLFPIAYNPVDMALYGTEPFVRAMETVWGIQEALTSTVQVAKTATEADIQQAGTQAKTGFKRDQLEDVLSDLGAYTAQIASYKLDQAKVRSIAGVEAFWIQTQSPEELDQMLSIEVRAGSSGKPDSAARREAWGATMPQIEKMIQAIAQLRGSSPLDVANCLEELLLETADRMGDRLDAKRFIPQEAEVVQIGPDGRPMAPGGPGAPQPEGGPGAPPAPGGGQPQPQNGQERLAPTETPAAIAG